MAPRDNANLNGGVAVKEKKSELLNDVLTL